MKTYESLVDAISDLRKKGYDKDFNLNSDVVECRELKLNMGPDEFHVDEVHRFEGMTNPDDSSVLFAISTKHGAKGVLVDAYGIYASLSEKMMHKFKIDKNTDP